MFIIYCLEHLESGKKYFGTTKISLDSAIDKISKLVVDKSHPMRSIQDDLMRFGLEAFSVQIVARAPDSKRAYNARSRFIKRAGTSDPARGYNFMPPEAKAARGPAWRDFLPPSLPAGTSPGKIAVPRGDLEEVLLLAESPAPGIPCLFCARHISEKESHPDMCPVGRLLKIARLDTPVGPRVTSGIDPC